VKLQLHLDAEERNEWKLAAEFADSGGLAWREAGCDRASG